MSAMGSCVNGRRDQYPVNPVIGNFPAQDLVTLTFSGKMPEKGPKAKRRSDDRRLHKEQATQSQDEYTFR